MKDCPEMQKLLQMVVGDEVIGFFKRELITDYQEVRVFTPVYKNTKLNSSVN